MDNEFDFSPLFRSTIGFDRLSRMLEAGAFSDSNGSYPPYNIVKLDENLYNITMAVAGFSEDDLEVTTRENQLIVSGKIKNKVINEEPTIYLHKGIAERSFERRFQLADHIKNIDASMENGLLSISLEREIPEQLKVRKIKISTSKNKKKQKLIEGKTSE